MLNKALTSVSFQVALHTNRPPDIKVHFDPWEFSIEETIIFGGMRQKALFQERVSVMGH